VLDGRRVLLAVTGGVAAYKSAYLARRLVEENAEVRVMLTDAAHEFIGPQTFAGITGHKPYTSLVGDERSVSPHTELARWANLIVVAPATANTIAKITTSISSDLVSATLQAAECPVLLAPAMHTEMWENAATRRNVATLVEDGYTIVGPDTGELAGGDVGMGRMVDPDVIVEALIGQKGPLAGRRVLVTAGGTREPIDPVRFIGNRSSGKMGNAVALAAARRGASVSLVTTAPAPRHPRIEVIDVETAQEMADAAWKAAEDADIAVMAAAVADFTPEDPAPDKLRRSEGPPEIKLVASPNVLGGIAAMPDRPFLVGFAAETGSLDKAIEKAKSYGVDMLVANDVTAIGSEFGGDTNEIVLVFPDGTTEPWELMTKSEVAERLIDFSVERWQAAGPKRGAAS